MSVTLPDTIRAFILQSTNARKLLSTDLLQSLWSGYGKIVRCHLVGTDFPSLILKWVRPQLEANHPRGWNTSTSHTRKLRSYKIEIEWYMRWAARCPETCRVPKYISSRQDGEESILLIEDLDASGFSERRDTLERDELKSCLDWLAAFHSRFIRVEPTDLWPTGTYWHLATRQDEWQNMRSGKLKKRAKHLDNMLSSARYQTIIHGDAKLANFCFSARTKAVSALDFQYVGGGVGVKDLAYFLSSCLDNDALFESHNWCLDRYFSQLKHWSEPTLGADAFSELENEWRSLYSVAVADFSRFLEGWNPGHWKLNDYTRNHVDQVLS